MLKKGTLFFGCLLLIGTVNNKIAAQGKKLKTIIVDAGHGGKDPGAVGRYENSLKSKEKDVTLAISLKLVAELKKKLPDLKILPTRTTDVYNNVKEKATIANEAKGDLFICIHADSGPDKKIRKQVGTKMVTKTRVTYSGKGKNRVKNVEEYEVEVPVYETFYTSGNRNGTSIYIFGANKTGAKEEAIMHSSTSEDSSFNNFNFSSPEGRQLAQIYAKLYQEKSDRIATLVNEEIEETGRKTLGVKQRQTGIWVLSATQMPAILIETGFMNNPEDEQYLNSEKGQQELVTAITNAVIKYRAQIENPKPVVTK